jgi:amino acid adenylation domain-containing protein/non-ribosomal peptide synthase protein (TIGR01720 family)
MFKITPAHLQALSLLPETPPSYVKHQIIVGGEQFPLLLLQKWKEQLLPVASFVNEYGPTETVVGCCQFKVDSQACLQSLTHAAVPIGQAINNTQLYVMDTHANLQPMGSVGELYIGGKGVALGYLNKQELTQRSFIKNPYAPGKLYKTGDLVRYHQDAQLEFIGRIDDQVKIRGHRIELQEIEQQLLAHNNIQSCVVIITSGHTGHQRLLAYFTHNFHQHQDIPATLRQHLQQLLPDYMLPSVFIEMDELPLTVNGKINLKALPDSLASVQDIEHYLAPANAIESNLGQIWSKVLGLPKESISTDANFFTLGGDSILSIQVVSQAAQAGLKISIKQIFEYQSIVELAPHVISSKNTIPQQAVTGEAPLLPIQHNFFSDETELHHYNQGVVLKIPQDFSPELLVECVEKLHQRHDALRLRFNKYSGQWQGQHQQLSQQMIKDSVVELKLNDFKQLEEQANHYQRSLNLQQGPMFLAIHCRNNSNKQRLVLIIHHLLVDGVSWRILIEDLQNLYQQQRNKQKLSLPAKSSSYQSWGQFLYAYSRSEKLLEQVDYWHKTVSTPVALLAIDNKATEISFTQEQLTLDKNTTALLLTKAQSAYRTQINELLLSALLLAIHRWKGHNSMRIDLESHGRQELNDDIDLSQTVGWFTSIFPLLLSSDDMSPQALICAVKEQYRAVPEQGIGFGLLKYLRKHNKLKDTEPSDLLFNYLGQFSDKTDDVSKQQKISMAQESIGDLVSPLRPPEHGLNFNGSVIKSSLSFVVDYQQQLYSKADITSLLNEFKKAIKELVSHCSQKDAGCLTPSDFPLAQLSQQQLNEWQRDYAIADIYPATAMQQGLLFHSAIDKSAYVSQLLFTLGSAVDIKAFQGAWQQAIDQFSTLRTLFLSSTSGEMYQLILQKAQLPWLESDLSALSTSEQLKQLKRDREQDKAHGFSLDQCPLLRITAWKLGQGQYHIMISNHHAIIDGWSTALLFARVKLNYQKIQKKDRTAHKAEIPYSSYAKWLLAQDTQKAQDYWKQQLADVSGPTIFTKQNNKQEPGYIKRELHFNTATSEALQQLAKQSQVTLNSLLQAIWAYLLSRYSNEETVVFGTTVSGRPAQLAGVEQMVGLFINSIPVRIDIPDKKPFNQWLKGIHAQQVERNEYAYLPLVEIQQLVDNHGETDLVDNLLVFENYPIEEDAAETEKQLTISDVKGFEETNYTLSATAVIASQLSMQFTAQKSHFSDKLLGQLCRHFEKIIIEVLKNPAQKVADISILTQVETDFLLRGSTNKTQQYPQELCIHHLLEKQAINIPEMTAIEFYQHRLSYLELNTRANQLAHLLIKRGVGRGNMVGLCMNRSLEMFIALTAILKTGAAYVPLDSSYPHKRLLHIIEDSNMDLLLTQSHLLNLLKNLKVEKLAIDGQQLQLKMAEYSVANPVSKALNSEQLAYVLYTSGSTGQPKGVMQKHRTIVNLVHAQASADGLNDPMQTLQFAPISFDVSIQELATSWFTGSSLRLISEEDKEDLNQLPQILQKYAIQRLFLPPAVLNWLAEVLTSQKNQLANLKEIIVAGETLVISKDLRKYLQNQPSCTLWNHYGPTETHVATVAKIDLKRDQDSVPIGRVLDNLSVLIVDRLARIVPYGAVGELYIGGAGIASGYLNQAQFTAEKFIQNPFNQEAVDVMYKTGDLVRYLYEDQLAFIGRADDQIQLRGFRIELGEIEQLLSAMTGVQNALVMIPKKGQEKRLVAYVCAASITDQQQFIASIKQQLQSQLPHYMIPSVFMLVDEFVLTANGKIDRKALPSPELDQKQGGYSAPIGALEKDLSHIWAQLLKIDPKNIGRDANFFELGGHSLLLTRMLHVLAKNLGLKLPLKRVLKAATIKDIAQLASNSQSNDYALQKQLHKGPAPLSFAQYRVWFIEQLKDHSNEHNMVTAVDIKGNFRAEIFQTALNALISQHEILRTRIELVDDQPAQLIEAELHYTVSLKDLRKLDGLQQQQKIRKLTHKHDTQVFDLGKLPLFSVLLLQTCADEFILHFNQHHIISDGWSQQLFYSQLMQSYQSILEGKNKHLSATKYQYRDYTYWQQEFLQSQQAQKQMLFWQNYLAGCREQLSLNIEGSQSDFDAKKNEHSIVVDPKTTKQLKNIAQTHKGSLFNVLHSSFAILMARLSGNSDFNLGLPVTGRHIYGSEDMLGMFLNNLPVRHQLDLQLSFTKLLQQQITNVEGVLSNQDIPFETLLEITACQRSVDNTPLFQILFNMLSIPQGQFSATKLGFSMQNKAAAEIENKFNMSLYLAETEQGIEIICHYNSSLYSHKAIAQMLEQYRGLLTQVTENSELPCAAYTLNVKPTIIHANKALKSHYRHDVTELFRQQVALRAEAIAVIDDQQRWSYQQLLQASWQIGLKLQKHGVTTGDIITINASRHVSLIISILAVLQTGAAYSVIAIDNTAPQIKQHLKAVEARIILDCETDKYQQMEVAHETVLITVSNDINSYQADTSGFITHDNKANQAACITFTSGSSGIPKGVLGNHKGLSSYLSWWPKVFNIDGNDRFSMLSGLRHDPLQRDIFSALCTGACVVIPTETDYTAYRFNQWLKAKEITVMHLTPAMAEVMIIEGIKPTESIKVILMTGEALRTDIVAGLRNFNKEVKIFNSYGATESQRASTAYQLPEQLENEPSIVPIAVSSVDTCLRLVNSQGKLCGVGEGGQIMIESAHLSQGYLNDNELTQQKFKDINDNIRSYNTGDMGIYLDNERIHYLGRSDSQINIRGYRVELGEIEFHLSQITQIQSAAVILKEQAMLVAYITVHDKKSKQTDLIPFIQAELAKALPLHMLPTRLVILPQLPLNANGKLNRKALQLIDVPAATELNPVLDQRQIQLSKIWSKLLNISSARIDSDANFFELGGHSLLIVKLSAEIRAKYKLELSIKTLFESKDLQALSQLIEERLAHKGNYDYRTLIEPRPNRSNSLQPSYAQQRLWFIDQMDGGSTHYNMVSALRMRGDFRTNVAQAAFTRIIQRHEILRTVFVDTDDGLLQVINKSFKFKITNKNLSHLNNKPQVKAVKQYLQKDTEKVFDLSKDIMLRVSYLKLSKAEGILLFNIHHIAADGWSIAVLIQEFVNIYQAILDDKEITLADLTIQYADYAYWQRNWLQGKVLKKQLDYWFRQLAELPQVHSLPLDYQRPQYQTFNGAIYAFAVDGKTLKDLKKLVLDKQITLFMLMHAAFAVMLSRYSNSNDIVLGTPVANRMLKELEPLIGFFVNTLVLRADCSGDPIFTDFLKQIKNTNLDAQENQDIPFEQLVERLQPSRSTAYNALFQVMLSMNSNEEMDLHLPHLEITAVEDEHRLTKFDLSLNVTEDQHLQLSFEYNTDLFSTATIKDFAHSLQLLLVAIAKDSSLKISQLPLLSLQQRYYLQHTLNDTQMAYPHESCIQQLFAQQVIRTPDNTAVIYTGQSLTYLQLDQQANQLAHYLIKQGAQVDDIIGLYFARSTDMLVAMLAILKAGAAYLPLDPNYPKARLSHMLADSKPIMIITQEKSLDINSGKSKLVTLADRRLREELSQFSVSCPTVKNLNSRQLAYVIYTSGSTGKPKGVMIEHRNVINMLCHFEQHAPCQQHFNAALWTTLNFDVSVLEIFSTILFGGQLSIVEEEIRLDSLRYFDWLSAEKINFCYLPPFFIEDYVQWLAANQAVPLQRLIVGVEPIKESLLREIANKTPQLTILNCYGPTEATVCSTAYKLSLEKPIKTDRRTPIGRPMSNYKTYVLDRHLNMVALGVVGELYIGGDSLARGYLNRERLTQQQFIQHQFKDGSKERLYKTGDLVRYLPAGELVFLGRSDEQVKIHGYRIELGEIETQLNNCEHVQSALVRLHQDKRLIAYFIVDKSKMIDKVKFIETVKSTLRKHLPDYMIPSLLLPLAAFPLTSNGKIDKKALPIPDIIGESEVYVAPTGITQSELVKIWSDLLKIPLEKLSTTANFFELGGHSLLLTRMLHAITEKLSIQLPIKSVFLAPTIKQMAAIIAQKNNSQQLLQRHQDKGPKPLSYGQYRVWFIEQLKDHSNEHNMAAAVSIKGHFKTEILQGALNAMIAEHEILRTHIAVIDDQPQQIIAPEYNYTLPSKDLRQQNDKQQQIKQLAYAHDTQVFKLNQLPLFSVLVIQSEDDEFILHFNQHHIISDGWSQQLFYSQLMHLYQKLLNAEEIEFNKDAFQYSDYAYWQHQFLQSEGASEQQQFWREYLDGCQERLSLSIENSLSDFDAGQSHQHIEIPLALSQQLKTLGQKHQGSLFNVLHSAFAVLIARLSGERDFNLGLPVTGRHLYGTEKMLGMFLNNLPIRHQLDLDLPYSQLLQAQINNIEQALSNQDIPFESILEICDCERSVDSTPLFQILFNMLSIPQEQSAAAQLGFSLENQATAEIENKFNMTLYLAETPQGININCHYNSSLYGSTAIKQMLSQYRGLLTQIGSDSEQASAAYTLNLKPNVIHAKKTLKSHYQHDVTELFRQQVKHKAQATAIIDGQEHWSYGQLLGASGEIGLKLQKYGITIGDIVTINASRHASIIIAIMAVLQTGAAYSVITADHTAAQIKQHLKAVQARIILDCQSDTYQPIKVTDNNITIITISNDHKNYRADTSAFVPHNNKANQAVCITFTSGSSGIPKGVIGSHKGLSSYLSWWPKHFNIGADDRFSMLSGLSHDPLQRDIFSALCIGARVVIPTEADYTAYRFNRWLKAKGVTVIHMTPAMAEVMIIEGIKPTESIKVILITGEALRTNIVSGLRNFNKEVVILNSYGATESQRASTAYQLPEQLLNEPSIIPIAVSSVDTRLKLVNSQGKLCGVGEQGEIMIESAHLSQGYLNDDELTQQKFKDISNGIRCYNTGDLGVYIDNERIHYLGRSDSQINIRGYRIELGEIEYHLSTLREVRSVAVLLKNNSQLLAFISVVETSVDKTELITHIKTQLKLKIPAHMVPTTFKVLDQLPINANGKLDRKALKHIKINLVNSTYKAAINQQEKILVNVLSKEFNIPKKSISMHANFFALGGNSLSILRVIKKLHEQGINKEIKQFYESRTLAQICNQQHITQSDLKTHCMVKLNTCKAGTPLYLIHPIVGRIDCYRQLANELHDVCPIYAIQAPFLSEVDCDFVDVEELARHYVKQILIKQPQGPYRLSGWSLGGRIAQKIALLLSLAGHEIEYFAVMDTFMIQKKSITLTPEQALEKAYWVFVTDLSETDSQAKHFKKLYQSLPDDLWQRPIETQIETLAEVLMNEFETHLHNKKQIILALKYATNLMTEKKSLSAISIKAQSVLFVASENEDKNTLIKGWKLAIKSPSILIDIEGEHNSLLSGRSYSQIKERFRKDLSSHIPI